MVRSSNLRWVTKKSTMKVVLFFVPVEIGCALHNARILRAELLARTDAQLLK